MSLVNANKQVLDTSMNSLT